MTLWLWNKDMIIINVGKKCWSGYRKLTAFDEDTRVEVVNDYIDIDVGFGQIIRIDATDKNKIRIWSNNTKISLRDE